MTLVCLLFAAGVLVLQQQATLPPWATVAWLVVTLPLAVAGAHRAQAGRAARRRRLLWLALASLAAFASGFLWAAFLAHHRTADRLDASLEGLDIEVAGVVSGLPSVGERSVVFDFEPEQPADAGELPSRLRIVWYRRALATTEEDPAFIDDAAKVLPGDRWRLTVRLRRPHGNLNPGGFDYEAWLLERGIGATGYVRGGARERLGQRDALADRVERARAAVRARFFAVLGETPAAGILVALAVGDQRALGEEEWRLFQRTGVTHLMSISGLHVTLVSGLFAWLVAAGWRRVPRLALALPARKAAAVAAILAAFGYTLLAGFAVPAQRTLAMVTVVAIALWAGRISSASRTLALALLAVLLADPWAVLAPGFWLSFGAVALIFWVTVGRVRDESKLLQWARVQWAMTVGLAPATLLFFGQVSVSGPVANAVAIPVVSAVITPLALLAAVFPVDAIAQFAAWLAEWLFVFLEWCDGLPLAVWRGPAPALWAVVLAMTGIVWMLAPGGTPGRPAAVALLLPAFLLPAPAPSPGEAWVTTLDVGQGLAVIVRTATRTLLYDAGPRYGPEADSAGRAILPALASQGVNRVDRLVLTHQDMDHIGGASTLLASIDVGSMISSLPDAHPLQALASSRGRCASGERWDWDGVAFEFLHPPREDARSGTRPNDLSCVLRVSAGGSSMLLTGDIEARVEAALVARAGPALASDVLLAPHHGSRTSSTVSFLQAVAATHVVFPTGYRNRFGHPAKDVVERYRARGMELLRTDLDGAIHVRLGPGRALIEAERRVNARYWR